MADKKMLLTDREMEILSKAWKCMKSQPEVSPTPTSLPESPSSDLAPHAEFDSNLFPF